MRTLFSICTSLLLGTGCLGDATTTTEQSVTAIGSAGASALVAFDAGGRPVRFAPDSGAILAAGAPLMGIERDVAIAPSGEVAVIVSPEGEDGWIHRDALGPAAASQSWPVSGRVELRFDADGLWLFEESIGQRWRHLTPDGTPTPSIPLPVPASHWSTPDGVGALTADPIRWIEATSDGVVMDLPLGIVPTQGFARGAPLGDHLALAWGGDSHLNLCRLDADGSLVSEWVLPLAGPVRQLAALPNDHVAVLLDTPPRLVRLGLGSPLTSAVLPLAGTLDEDKRVDRRLLAHDGRLYVALDDQVLAVNPSTLTVDPHFDGNALRGPLAAP